MELIEDMERDQKVAQVYQAILNFDDPKTVNRILEKGVNVNWKIPAHCLRDSIKLDSDATLLHVAHARNSIGCFKLLIDQGAEFTIKDRDGSTILHRIIENFSINRDNMIDMILCAHVRFGNSHNPCNKNGLSHLHIACMANHLDAVKFFLSNGALIDQHVNMDSLWKPGYNSLHFSVEFNSHETAEFLISSGANVHFKNANKMTPLHLLVKARLEMLDLQCAMEKKNLNEKLIKMLLENDTSSCDATDGFGLSKFHMACLLQDSLVAESLSGQVSDINHAVESDSPICPGYTGLHFAAHCSVETVVMLIKKGANMTVKDAEETTPLDICLRWFTVQDIYSTVALVPTWKSMLFSDGKTKLMDCILAMKTPVGLKKFLQKCNDVNTSLPKHSVLWPCSTVLHLAVVFSERSRTNIPEAGELMKVCLDQGADIHAQDKHGSTPLHLAFRQGKQQVMNYLFKIHTMAFKEVVNLTDKYGLSYLHITSINVSDTANTFAKKLLSVKGGVKSAVNATYKGKPLGEVKPGWTPLHVAVRYANYKALAMFVKQCGNFLKTDVQGITPIHLLLRFGHDKDTFGFPLNFKKLGECVVKTTGLSHLHVASWFDEAKAVKMLLDKGSDVEAVIRQPLGDENSTKFVGCRPLHLAVMSESKEATTELLRRGADILAKKPDTTSALSLALKGSNKEITDMFANVLWKDDRLQKLLEMELGLTMLHIACHLRDVDRVKDLLHQGVDVNARAHGDSIIWPGCSPLHLLMGNDHYSKCNVSTILDLLLENGADMFAMDAQQRTPLLLTFKLIQKYCTLADCGKLVLKYHRDFSINPMDNEGLSYFHLACLTRNLEAVEKFLQQSRMDVNRPINFLASVYAGYSPLHLAVCDLHYCNDNHRQSVVELPQLLLNHSAKASAQNSFGSTPLHLLVQHQGTGICKVMNRILDFCYVILNNRAADERITKGLLFSEAEIHEMHLFVDHHGHINARSHNDYLTLIAWLIKCGCNIDHQDMLGKTALHLAVKFKNKEAASVLLMSGADFNIVDLSNKSAFSCVFEPGVEKVYCRGQCTLCSNQKSLVNIFDRHVKKLKYLRIEVRDCNDSLLKNSIREFVPFLQRTFINEVFTTENVNIGRGCLTLRSFLCETGAISHYPYILPNVRDEVTVFFETIDFQIFSELKYILKLQYRKAVARLSLIDPAGDSLNALLSIPLPYLCLKTIFLYLSNSDLKNLIAASFDEEDDRLIVDL